MIGDWDASAAKTTKPMKAGSALPAACATGEAFFKTGASAGQNLYLCKPDNTWTQVSGGASSYSLVFDGAATALADGSTVAWTCGSGSGAQCTTTWTVPTGVNFVRTKMWAGGGGGGGSSPTRGGPGAGGGGYYETVCPTTPGASLAIAVGLGGIGSTTGYSPTAGAGGNSSITGCVTVTGGDGGRDDSYGGKGGLLYGAPVNPIITPNSGAFNALFDLRGTLRVGGAGFQAGRIDQGGWGAGQTATGTAGLAGGSAIGGAGAGGSGGFNHATGGAGGASALGGAGGAGGGWTAGGGLVACGNGTIPGGAGGGAGVETAGGSNHTGCSGARGEVRIYYAK